MARMSHTAQRYFAENPHYKVCREGRHAWPRQGKLDTTSATLAVETKQCSDCGAVKTIEINRRTGRKSSKTKLPEGYSLKGERISRDDLDLLLAADINDRLARRRSIVAQLKKAG